MSGVHRGLKFALVPSPVITSLIVRVRVGVRRVRFLVRVRFRVSRSYDAKRSYNGATLKRTFSHRGWIKEFSKVGQARWSDGRETPSEVQEQSPGRRFGDEVPQKLKQNVELVYDFNVFLNGKFTIK